MSCRSAGRYAKVVDKMRPLVQKGRPRAVGTSTRPSAARLRRPATGGPLATSGDRATRQTARFEESSGWLPGTIRVSRFLKGHPSAFDALEPPVSLSAPVLGATVDKQTGGQRGIDVSLQLLSAARPGDLPIRVVVFPTPFRAAFKD